jgi:POT family proton-dependent oligopeptide transporter
MQEPDVRERPIAASVTAEALERLAFHGLCAVLVLALNEHLLYGEREARSLFHLFLAGVYLAPIAGRAVAARLGRLRTVRLATALHLAGLALLAAVESRAALAAGLVLVAVGAGGAMPATSSIVGERLGSSGPEAAGRARAALRRAVLGASLAAKLGAPLLLVTAGPRAAFAAAAVALAAGALLARADRAGLVDPPAPPDRHGFLRVVSRALSRIGTGAPGQGWLDLARDIHPAEAVEGARAVLRLAPVFAALTLFWALFDQRASAWVFQARQLDLAVGGVRLSPAQLQALSPALVLLVAPLLARVVLPALERRGVALPPLRRVGAGLFAAASSFVAAGALQLVVESGRIPHGAWQLPQYLLLTVGEVLVSVTGLELAYAQAPRSMRGTIMSIGFLTVSAGNLLVGLLGGLLRLDGPAWYLGFAAVGLGVAFAFRAVTRAWRAGELDEAAPESQV